MIRRVTNLARPMVALALLAAVLFGSISLPIAYALDAPNLLAPDDGFVATAANTPPLGVPELSWTPVVSATTYRVQLSRSIGFEPKIEFTTANTSYTPVDVAALPDGVWYWRVRADAPSPAGEYSGYRTFTKLWASAENAPALTAPADGATLSFYTLPKFSWTAVSGAASYCFQISASTTFPSTCPTTNQPPSLVQTLATTYQPTSKLANGEYFWRVLPIDPGGQYGTPSEVQSFTAAYQAVPTLLEPAPDNFPVFTPTFRWEAVEGAQFYRLEYSTDPTFNTDVTPIETRNTTYTPLAPLPNDVNYYWRVRVQSGLATGFWSEVRVFRKRWYIQPQLLTPTNNAQHVEHPFFSWAPVAGASWYRIEINSTNSFPPASSTGWSDLTAYPYYAVPDRISTVEWCWSCAVTWYWQVIPIDAAGNEGLPSQVSSFNYGRNVLSPVLMFPRFFYEPDMRLQPHEDRSAALPVFMWNRVVTVSTSAPLTGVTNAEPGAYWLQVDDGPSFTSTVWEVKTENLAAAPTSGPDQFVPSLSTTYYWRVRPLTGLAGAETGNWSQTWQARFDPSVGLPPTASVVLLRPTHGAEVVDAFPLLEWWPRAGADAYRVQVSQDATFASVTFSATVPYPAYIPQSRSAFGTYYWRVQALSGGTPLGDWTPAWRFQVAAQSQWLERRNLPGSDNRLLIGSDAPGDAPEARYDVTSLYAAQSAPYWHFGFDVTAGGSDRRYALYLDLDHQDGAGAISDPLGHSAGFNSAHQPEFAIHVLRSGGAYSANQVTVHRWLTTTWAAEQTLAAIGGTLTATSSYVEIAVPNTAIGMQDTTGSAAVILVSLAVDPDVPQDSAPADPGVTGSAPGTLSRFTSVSERLNLVLPPNDAGGDPTTLPTLPPFHFDFPAKTQWWGYQFQAATDAAFTSVKCDYTIYAGSRITTPLVPPAYTRNATTCDVNNVFFGGDNTYYWRVRPVYVVAGQPTVRGAWSSASRFERVGFKPGNLQVSVSFATPTFSWDMVEGARYYDLEVDDDPNFGSPAVDIYTERSSYTPLTTLGNGTYYWRVRVRQYAGSTSTTYDVVSAWQAGPTVVLNLPVPSGPVIVPAGPVSRAPTFCWDTVLAANGAGEPVLAAYKYRVQVSQDANFSSPYDTFDTEQTCWTPTKGYADGTYYWRVAMIDGNASPARVGAYQPAPATFVKQYPIPTQLTTPAGTPTFVWQPVAGAAEYRLEISQASTFSPLFDSVTTDNTRYTATKKYTPGQFFFWRVAAIDKNGNRGAWQGATVIIGNYTERLYVPMLRR